MRVAGIGRASMLLVAASLSGCAAVRDNMQGPMQPQATTGPCEVKRFFLLGFRSVPTTLAVRNTGEACVFTLVNPALNAVINANLLTGAPSHGRAEAGLIGGNRQAVVSYVPSPGYAGPDRFDITLEPGAVGVTFKVTVAAQ